MKPVLKKLSALWSRNVTYNTYHDSHHFKSVIIIACLLAKLSNLKNIQWKIGNAENLPVNDNCYEYYSISFGLRITKNIDKSLSEAFRVLRPGGRFFCLEFSKVENENLDLLYANYSKFLPLVGKLVLGDSMPYKYLTESIKNFIDQKTLIELMKKTGFENCSYRNLSGGVAAIHSGWKI